MPWEVKTAFPVSTMWRGERKRKRNHLKVCMPRRQDRILQKVCVRLLAYLRFVDKMAYVSVFIYIDL